MTSLESSIKALIAELQANRNLPKYQFERCSEPFLALFLSEAIEHHFGLKVSIVAPEFPLKKENNQSTNVDFAFKILGQGWLFVEVKTVAEGPRPEQISAYRQASQKTVNELANDVKTIRSATTEKRKYDALLERVENCFPHIGNPRFLYLSPHKENPVACESPWLEWRSFETLFAGFQSRNHPELWRLASGLFELPPQ